MASELSEDQQREIVGKYRDLREEVEALYAKMGQIDSDKSEHEIVLRQLTGLEADRRCWHQIGAVLAEKKVGDVVPILTVNRDQFNEAIKQISETIRNKEKEIRELEQKYGIREMRK